jgi:hypothetical protein
MIATEASTTPVTTSAEPRLLADAAADLEPQIVARTWRRHEHWSALAAAQKRGIMRWRTAALILAATGALLQTTAAMLGAGLPGTALCVISAVALVFVPFIAKFLLAPEQVRIWLRARSASEGLQSMVYRFHARVAPFDGSDRLARFTEAGKQLESWASSLAMELASVEPVTSVPPGPLDAERYVDQRIRHQIERYYRPRARQDARLALRFRQLELAAGAVAAALGAIATGLKLAAGSLTTGIGAWVAVITTIGGAVAAHSAANRYEQQARTYFATARHLEDLLDEWIAQGRLRDPTRWSAFVAACEDVISAENHGWMAKLDREEQRAS